MTLAKDTLKIGIVAGEHSGDILGSQLIEELSKSREIKLFGVGGPKIESHGLESMFDFKHLQIMGLIEPLYGTLPSMPSGTSFSAASSA